MNWDELLWGKRTPQKQTNTLDDILFCFPDSTPYTVRDLLRSIEVKGITGSGKSSGSGDYVEEAIFAHPRATVFKVAQKPEEKEIFIEKCRRNKKPFIVMEPGSEWKCNPLDVMAKAGVDTLGLVEFWVTLGEALRGGKNGGDYAQFFKMLEERVIFGSVEALRLGLGDVTAPNLRRFIATAPYSRERLADPAWKAQFHHQTMAKAWAKEKTSIEKANFELIDTFWTDEFANMDDKPRSSALAGVMNAFHTANIGLVREMTSETTFGPGVMDEGVSALINLPFSEYGPTGRYIAGSQKYLWQKHILRRKWDPNGYFNVMVLDEYQESATELDARYLSQCRSHGGCLFTLTQTIHSEQAAMSEHGHHHRADQLLSNFGLHIFHTVDAHTAKFASEMLGMQREVFISVTPDIKQPLGEEIFGNSRASCNVSESWQPILQPSALAGLRSGGPPDNVVDGVCIRLGVPYRSGSNWIYMSFPQR